MGHMKKFGKYLAPLFAALFMLSASAQADGRDATEKSGKAASKTKKTAKKTGKKAEKKSAENTKPKDASKAKPKPKPASKTGRTVKPPTTAAKNIVVEPAKKSANKNPVEPMPTSAQTEVPIQKHKQQAEDENKLAPPKPRDIFVLFESKPSNAEVLIDGFYSGSTPVQLTLKEGSHSVKMIYPGYSAWTTQIKPYKGMRLMSVLEEAKQAVAPVATPVAVPAATPATTATVAAPVATPAAVPAAPAVAPATPATP